VRFTPRNPGWYLRQFAWIIVVPVGVGVRDPFLVPKEFDAARWAFSRPPAWGASRGPVVRLHARHRREPVAGRLRVPRQPRHHAILAYIWVSFGVSRYGWHYGLFLVCPGLAFGCCSCPRVAVPGPADRCLKHRIEALGASSRTRYSWCRGSVRRAGVLPDLQRTGAASARRSCTSPPFLSGWWRFTVW